MPPSACCRAACGDKLATYASCGAHYDDDVEEADRVKKLLSGSEAPKRRPCLRCCICSCGCLLVLVITIVVVLALNGVTPGPFLQAMQGPVATPAGWIGPERVDGELWGGPTLEWTNQEFISTAVKTSEIQNHMTWAGVGSTVPAGLQGVFWIDSAGASSIAKGTSFKFNFPVTLPELLATFGEGVAQYEESSRCITPIPMYGGKNWAAKNKTQGYHVMDFHHQVRNTASFCFFDASFKNIQIQAKGLASQAAWGPIVFGPVIARLLGYIDAGDGYMWTSLGALNMTMNREPWGWDRETHIWSNPTVGTSLRSFLLSLLPDWTAFNELLTLVDMPVGHYPLIQIIDGHGAKTEYHQEFLDYMSTVDGGDHVLLRLPKSDVAKFL